jgi:hypothetical protein
MQPNIVEPPFDVNVHEIVIVVFEEETLVGEVMIVGFEERMKVFLTENAPI